MKYRNYKRQVRLSSVLDKELNGEFLELNNVLNELTSGIKLYTDEYRYPNTLFYFKGHHLVYIINKTEKSLMVGETLDSVLYHDFSFTSNDLDEFCIDMVNDTLKVCVDKLSLPWDENILSDYFIKKD
jgi:hypothetical protein